MKRVAVLLVALAVTALGGCKSPSDQAAYSVEPPAPPPPPPRAPPPPPPPPEPPPVATEEDFEEEVAKQITDKNIEKELDALAHELKPRN